MTETSVDSFFENIGGSRAPSFAFSGKGTGVIGTIIDQYATVVTDTEGETKLDKNNNAQPQLNVTLQTDLRGWDKVKRIPTDPDGNPLPASEDTGERRIFVKYQMRRAIADALRKVSAKKLEDGGRLGVKVDGEMSTGKVNPLPTYTAVYELPAKGTSDSFFADEPLASTPIAAQDTTPPF